MTMNNNRQRNGAMQYCKHFPPAIEMTKPMSRQQAHVYRMAEVLEMRCRAIRATIVREHFDRAADHTIELRNMASEVAYILETLHSKEVGRPWHSAKRDQREAA